MNKLLDVLRGPNGVVIVGGLVVGGIAIGVGTYLVVKHLKKKAADKTVVELKEDEFTVEMED